jgi:hypothetical protein
LQFPHGSRIPWCVGLAYFGQMIDHEAMQERFAVLARHLDERGRRMFAAAEAKA